MFSFQLWFNQRVGYAGKCCITYLLSSYILFPAMLYLKLCWDISMTMFSSIYMFSLAIWCSPLIYYYLFLYLFSLPIIHFLSPLFILSPHYSFSLPIIHSFPHYSLFSSRLFCNCYSNGFFSAPVLNIHLVGLWCQFKNNLDMLLYLCCWMLMLTNAILCSNLIHGLTRI